MKKYFALAAIAAFLISCTQKSVNTIYGTVTDGDAPLAGVVVSDGVSVVKTDKDGRYEMPYDRLSGKFVFISTPAGYKSSSFPGETCFYSEVKPGKAEYDFAVTKKDSDDTHHTVIVLADPQISDSDDLVPLEDHADDMAKTVSGIEGDVFGIGLGDMVGWDHPLYKRINKIFSRVGIDFRYTIGNHDMTNWGRSYETSFTEYEKVFGPVYYSFNVGKVHYVVMDDNFYVGRDYFYIGYLDERQLAWLEKDLSFVEKGSPVVVCMHIPTTLDQADRDAFQYGIIGDNLCNKPALYSLLEPYKALILSGHMHTNTNHHITDNLTEHNIGGMCGAWWCGDCCIDGCPAGYKVYTWDGEDVSWYYKGTGYPQDHQMKVYDNDPMYPGEVIAHVWDVDEAWKVEYFEDDVKICDMERFKGYDPHPYEIFKDASIYKISWVCAFETPNLFRAVPQNGAARREIRVTDRFGRIFTEKL